LGIRGCWF
jgi:Cu-processing system ATP-binding protein